MNPESKGRVARQAHVEVPEGTFEEEHGRQGFFGRSSHLYHLRQPTGWTRIEGPLRPRCFEGEKLDPDDAGDSRGGPVEVARNDDCAVLISRRSAPMPYFFRNADADELHFVHRGAGVYETDYGVMSYAAGDYVYLPKGTTYQLVPRAADNFFLVVRSAAEFQWPDRGLLGRHAFLDPQLLESPEPAPHDETGGDWELRVLRGGEFTSFFYPHHPLDVVGWRGDLAPVRFNVRDMRPIVSARYHLPPTVHATLFAEACAICTFAPRPLESDPGCQKVPYFHRNVDWDELIFYHSGNFFSRSSVGAAYLTLHPQGIHHGPQPGAFEAAKTRAATEEVAILIETRRPLWVTEVALAAEVRDYATSWAREAAARERRAGR